MVGPTRAQFHSCSCLPCALVLFDTERRPELRRKTEREQETWEKEGFSLRRMWNIWLIKGTNKLFYTLR